MIDTKERPERVILAAVSDRDADAALASLSELEALADTAGAEVLELFLQTREHPHPGTYFGSGKLEELKERVRDLEADGVICDDELTPAQMRNMSDILNTKVQGLPGKEGIHILGERLRRHGYQDDAPSAHLQVGSDVHRVPEGLREMGGHPGWQRSVSI